MFSAHVDPGHEFVDGIGLMTCGEARERSRQPVVRVDGVEFAAFDERGDHRPVIAAFVRSGEQGILAVQGHRRVILPMSGRW